MVRHLLCVAVMAVSAGCVNTRTENAPGFDDALAAAQMRYQMRLSEDGKFPHDALMRAAAQRDAMIAAGNFPEVGDWTPIGPGNVGGRLRGILVHPGNPNVMWAGAASGGVWKTTDGGGSWTPLDDFLPSLAVGCLAIDPQNPDVLYCGSGEGFFETIEGTSNTAAVRGAGIFKSTDGGTTWTQIPSTASSPDWYFVNRIAFQPGSNQVMIAATTTGLWRSTDAGSSWTRVFTGYMYDVRFHPTDPLRAVAGGHDIAPRYSIDGGVTWLASTGFTTLPHRTELNYAPSNPNTVYAAVAIGNTLRVWRSTNGGQAWTVQTANAGIASLNPYTGVLWVDPNNINHLLMGGQQMYRSTDGGVTLTQTYTGLHADHHIITPHPAYNGTTNKTLFFGTDGGIYRTTDSAGTAVTKISTGLSITQFYGAAVNDSSGVVIAGAQDNGTNRYTGNPLGWTLNVIGGDGAYCASDPTDPNFFYGASQRLAIRRSSNGGATFASSVNNGLTDAGSLNCNFIPYFVLDPNDPNRMLAAARRIWRSNNIKTGAPVSWSIIRPSIESATPPPDPRPQPDHYSENSPFNASTIAIAKGNSDVVWVGYNNGHVARTANGTAASPAWTQVDQNGVGLPDRWISRIVISPDDHQRVYVSVMGYASNNVWMTINNGATWTDITGSGVTGLPDVPVQSLALHPAQPGRLFAGTDLGLFETTNNGQTWAPIVPGIGAVSVDELVWRNDSTLMAVTHGRGVFFGHVPASSACYPDCNLDGALNVQDFGCFQTRFVGGDTYADCNGDGQLTAADFGCFQTRFVAGCP